MIVSVHIPKTAGTSFDLDLTQVFGSRMLRDYADWVESSTPEAVAFNKQRRDDIVKHLRECGGQYDIIHGHFAANKYTELFPVVRFVTIVRDPYQHAISAYEHGMRTENSNHPAFPAFKEGRMTLVEFIEAVPNHQAAYFGGVPLDGFSMVGLTEEYPKTVALFEALFGVAMPHNPIPRNVNPAKASGAYEIAPEVRLAVERFRAEDIALYRQARERFDKLCSKFVL